jgi:magnesium transporter
MHIPPVRMQISAGVEAGSGSNRSRGRARHHLRNFRWACIRSDGTRDIIFNKSLVRELSGVPYRDMRVTEPALHYPPSIMIRERAIIVNLEHVKVIITVDCVLVHQTDHPLVPAFIERMAKLLLNPSAEDERDLSRVDERALSRSKSDGGEERRERPKPHARAHLPHPFHLPHVGSIIGHGRAPTPGFKPPSGLEIARHTTEEALPFELHALEICLMESVDHLCTHVDRLVKDAVPIFDRLAGSVNKTLLEDARKRKTRLARLAAATQGVRSAIDQLLDSESELLSLQLTRKRNVLSSRRGTLAGAGLVPDAGQEAEEREAVEAAENMLESYFEQVDGCTSKLDELREYIDNTEDLVAIELDSHRNELIQLDLLMTIATLCLAAYSTIGSIFGMNVQFWRDDYSDLTANGLPGPDTFNSIVLWSLGGVALTFCLIVFYATSKRLLIIW